jgi:hypothetical protein
VATPGKLLQPFLWLLYQFLAPFYVLVCFLQVFANLELSIVRYFADQP